MCFGAKVDRSMQAQQEAEAAQARATEEARQGRIRAGMSSVDNTFAGFNDDFYGKRRTSFMDFYQPQLDDQFSKAREALTFALADAGLLNSSIAGEKTADLNKAYETQRGSILSKADADVNSLKGRIANEKSTLVSQLNATADADRVSNEALSRSAALYKDVPDYSPLGDLFSGIGTGIGAVAQRQNNDAVMAAAGLKNPRRSAVSYTGG